MNRLQPRSDSTSIIALVKGSERYVFLYDEHHRADVLNRFGRFASNPELSFTWYDAAVLAKKVREREIENQLPAIGDQA